MIYAVDFDQTLTIGEYKFPGTGKPNIGLFNFLIEKRKAGCDIVLWTCREGDDLAVAVGYCRNLGLEFDAVNDNVSRMKEAWGNNPRKVFADCYIDDRAVNSYTELLPKSKVELKEIPKKKARIIRR